MMNQLVLIMLGKNMHNLCLVNLLYLHLVISLLCSKLVILVSMLMFLSFLHELLLLVCLLQLQCWSTGLSIHLLLCLLNECCEVVLLEILYLFHLIFLLKLLEYPLLYILEIKLNNSSSPQNVLVLLYWFADHLLIYS